MQLARCSAGAVAVSCACGWDVLDRATLLRISCDFACSAACLAASADTRGVLFAAKYRVLHHFACVSSHSHLILLSSLRCLSISISRALYLSRLVTTHLQGLGVAGRWHDLRTSLCTFRTVEDFMLFWKHAPKITVSA